MKERIPTWTVNRRFNGKWRWVVVVVVCVCVCVCVWGGGGGGGLLNDTGMYSQSTEIVVSANHMADLCHSSKRCDHQGDECLLKPVRAHLFHIYFIKIMNYRIKIDQLLVQFCWVNYPDFTLDYISSIAHRLRWCTWTTEPLQSEYHTPWWYMLYHQYTYKIIIHYMEANDNISQHISYTIHILHVWTVEGRQCCCFSDGFYEMWVYAHQIK